jgi:hypothetical protein
MRAAPIRSYAFALGLGAVLLGLCACAGVRWHKADGGDAALAQDLAACRRQVQKKVGIIGSPGPSTPMDPRFGAPLGPSMADQMMQESQMVGFCMRDKGYTLVPDNK